MKLSTRRAHNSNSMVVFIFGTILFLVILAEISEAKRPRVTRRKYGVSMRGCSAFGHACYGGHGKKRTDVNFPIQTSAEEDTFINGSGEEMEPVMLSPSATNRILPSNDDNNEYMPPLNGYTPIVYQKYLRQINLSPFLRKWLQSYRRSQQEQHLLDDQQQQQQLQLENL
ncbi:neuropeptide CCHamide-2-like isoform X1 [Chrysoperla carnea]|uniref:neuropeptide CCHamide-2-like isoform X1 n=1 Tax=Chrysoperla carnea TaxID=189513 RepID=UPI001D0974D5|nr:neuropeptide CCHamide-2-like isoform X1 [Chrysoperla carnea]